MSGRRQLTQIPADIEYYPMEHVVNLLRVIAAERDEFCLQLSNEQAKSATAAAAAAAAAVGYPTHQPHHPHHPVVHHHHPHHATVTAHHHPVAIPTTNAITTTTEAFGFPFTETTDTATHALVAAAASIAPPPTIVPPNNHNDHIVPSSFKVDAVKKRIAKKSYTLVKKTPHNKAKKPFTEINEAVPNSAAAMALFEGFEPKSDTNRLTKWDLTGTQVMEWLQAPKYVHPVKFDGKVIAFGGTKPFVYAWASYDSLQAKFDKKGASLSLKFRTRMVGSGRPDEGSNSPPCLS